MSDEMNNFYLTGHVVGIKKIGDKMTKLTVEFPQTGKTLPQWGRVDVMTFQGLSGVQEADDVVVHGRLTYNTFQKKDGTEGSAINFTANKVISCGKVNHEYKVENTRRTQPQTEIKDEIPF